MCVIILGLIVLTHLQKREHTNIAKMRCTFRIFGPSQTYGVPIVVGACDITANSPTISCIRLQLLIVMVQGSFEEAPPPLHNTLPIGNVQAGRIRKLLCLGVVLGLSFSEPVSPLGAPSSTSTCEALKSQISTKTTFQLGRISMTHDEPRSMDPVMADICDSHVLSTPACLQKMLLPKKDLGVNL